MANVITPLFSLSASGKFSDFIIFRSRSAFRSDVSFLHPIKRETPTVNAIYRRIYGMLCEDIRICSTALINYYRGLSHTLNMSWNNYLLKDNYDKMINTRYGNSCFGLSRYG